MTFGLWFLIKPGGDFILDTDEEASIDAGPCCRHALKNILGVSGPMGNPFSLLGVPAVVLGPPNSGNKGPALTPSFAKSNFSAGKAFTDTHDLWGSSEKVVYIRYRQKKSEKKRSFTIKGGLYRQRRDGFKFVGIPALSFRCRNKSGPMLHTFIFHL